MFNEIAFANQMNLSFDAALDISEGSKLLDLALSRSDRLKWMCVRDASFLREVADKELRIAQTL